ncbi:MAG: hypothetical protein CL920_23630 [Deltaproteobacteria bacterium]|nr:hypothetical protein [Deltaproteobacteria bacterium]MBU51692.1 hypothetical protein [Deltaproteobacteria bacterium]|tara:strand:+ start:2022 stop:3326 length:1305 start_codon:yes stop_codon:yes gene_type:complete
MPEHVVMAYLLQYGKKARMDIKQWQETLEGYFQQHQEHYLNLLKAQVDINSYTYYPEGIDRLAEVTAEQFAPLGFTSEMIRSECPGCGHHLVMTRKGTTKHSIALISHLDTVYTEEEEARNNFSWRVDGDRIYGPGTIDIKGGTVMIYMILSALQDYAPEVYDAIEWKVMLNSSEEDDATHFGQVCLSRFDEHTIAGLVFELGHFNQEEFQLVIARKGRGVYNVHAHGRRAHAGTQHPKGANAILQLADVIQKIEAITDYSRDLTFNVGHVEGGTVANSVPSKASLLLELRSFDREAFRDGVAQLEALDGYSSVTSADGEFSCRVEVEKVRETGPWPINDGTDHLFSIWERVGGEMGLKAIRQERGGLSDGNLICHKVPVLDGLGPAGANAHCSEHSEDGSKEQEYLDVPSLTPKAALNTVAIMELCKEVLDKE